MVSYCCYINLSLPEGPEASFGPWEIPDVWAGIGVPPRLGPSSRSGLLKILSLGPEKSTPDPGGPDLLGRTNESNRKWCAWYLLGFLLTGRGPDWMPWGPAPGPEFENPCSRYTFYLV